MARNRPLEEYIGEKFGDWEVVGIGEPKYHSNGKGKPKSKLVTLKCKCNCGLCNNTIKDITLKNLKAGRSNSCGNKGRIKTGKNNKKYNTYDITREFGIGYTDKGEEFYFDLEDYNKIKDYCWHRHQDGYMRTFKRLENGEMMRILMHNLIFEKENLNNDIDHINGKPNDNRKSNLRECSHCDNMKNTKIRKDNKSGVSGVYILNNKWKAHITINKQRINLGTFKNKEDAIKARLLYEKEYFGEFAPQKYLFEKYNI